MTFWGDKRVAVTGGAGFLGSFVVEALRRRGAREVFVPRKAEYDLRQQEAVLALLSDARPNLVIHLAAERYNKSEPVNIGSGFEISIKQLTETIARLTGFEGRTEWDTTQPNGQPAAVSI